MRRAAWLFLLAAISCPAQEPAADVVTAVGEYFAADTPEPRLREIEDNFIRRTPIATLELALRRCAWGERAFAPGKREVELTVPGTKDAFRLFVFLPEGYDGTREWPAVLSMHGTCPDGGASDERDRWMRKSKGGDEGFVVLCPQETEKLWGKGWGSTAAERALNLGALEHAMRAWRIDPDRVFLGGVSRGGHATWELGMLHGDRFAGLYPNAGGPRLINLGYVANLGKLPLFQVLGAKDQPQLVENVRAAVAQLKEAGAEVDYREHADRDHGVGYEDDRDFAKWVLARKRELFPKAIVHAFPKPAQGRAYWVEATKVAPGALDPFSKAPAVNLKPGTKPTDAEIRALYVEKLKEGLARFEAKVEGNRIDITTQKVTELVVYLSDRLVDLSKPVEIWINGRKKHDGMVERDAVKAIRHVKATGDRSRVFANAVRLQP